MKHTFRVLFVAIGLLVGEAAIAQSGYPEKPVRLIVGFPAGSGIDIVARVLSQGLADALGRPVVVENVPGAGGGIATERVAHAAPDGYTLGLASQGQVIINPLLQKTAVDPVKNLVPISQVYLSSNLLVVGNAAPGSSVRELIALAKARPGEFTFATGGPGSSPHLAGMLFRSMADVDIREVPYKGVNVAIPDLLGGRVTMMFSPIAEVSAAVREGKLRALAVTSLQRSPTFPDLPTIDEAGVRGFDVTFWGGLFAPAGTNEAIVRRLQAETAKALARDELQARFVNLGVRAGASSSREFAALIEAEAPRWARIVRDAGIKADQ